jgi:acetyltransferase-like isoleucine patch superfamily enzyme
VPALFSYEGRGAADVSDGAATGDRPTTELGAAWVRRFVSYLLIALRRGRGTTPLGWFASYRAVVRRGVPILGERHVGANAVVAGRLTVGDEAVIAANALVTWDVPPRAVVIGNPAQVASFNLQRRCGGRG